MKNLEMLVVVHTHTHTRQFNRQNLGLYLSFINNEKMRDR